VKVSQSFESALRRLALQCQFGSGLEERVRDQFIYGLAKDSAAVV